MNSISYNPKSLQALSYKTLWNILKNKSKIICSLKKKYIDFYYKKYSLEYFNLQSNFNSINYFLPNQLKIDFFQILSSIQIIACKFYYCDYFKVYYMEIKAIKAFKIYPKFEMSEKLCDDIAFKLASYSRSIWEEMDINYICVSGISYINNTERNPYLRYQPSIGGVCFSINTNSQNMFNKIFPHLYAENLRKNYFEDEDFTGIFYRLTPTNYDIRKDYITKSASTKFDYSMEQYILKNKSTFYNFEKFLLIKKLLKI